jgi:hypothetical protein
MWFRFCLLGAGLTSVAPLVYGARTCEFACRGPVRSGGLLESRPGQGAIRGANLNARMGPATCRGPRLSSSVHVWAKVAIRRDDK